MCSTPQFLRTTAPMRALAVTSVEHDILVGCRTNSERMASLSRRLFNAPLQNCQKSCNFSSKFNTHQSA